MATAEAGLTLNTSGLEDGQKRAQAISERLIAQDNKIRQSMEKNETALQILGASRVKREEVQYRQRVKFAEMCARDVEAMEKEGAARRIKIAEQEMSRRNKLEKDRLTQLTQNIRARQFMAGEGGSSGSARGSGGHGGGFSGDSVRFAGDAMDQVTGTPGWVFRLRGLSHLMGRFGLTGSAAMLGGGLAGVAGLAGAKLFSEARAASAAMGASHADFDSTTAGLRRTVTGSFTTQPLTEARIKLLEQQKKLEEQSARLQNARFGSGSIYQNIGTQLGALGQHPMNFFRRGGADLAVEEETRTNELERGLTRRLGEFARKKSGAASEVGVRIASAQGVGNTFESRRAELDLQKQELENSEEFKTASKEEKDNRMLALSILRNTVDKEEELASKRFGNSTRRLSMEKEIGNTQEGQRAILEQQIADSQKLLNYGKLGVEQWRQEFEVLKGAESALKRFNLELAVSRAQNASQIARGNIALGVAGVRAGANLYTANEPARFAAGQSVERAEAAGNVANARRARNDATLDVAREIVFYGKANEHTITAQILAEQALTEAKNAQLETERKLNFEAKERTHQLRVQFIAAQNQTQALRIANTGRGDLAGLFSERAQAAALAQEAIRSGHPEMANEIRAQQQGRETGQIDDIYLNASGRPRSRSAILARIRLANRVARHRNRFNAALMRSGGRIAGKDPFTGRAPSDQSVSDQKIADQSLADQTGFGGLASGHLATGQLATGMLRAGGGGMSDDSWANIFGNNSHTSHSPMADNQPKKQDDERDFSGGKTLADACKLLNDLYKIWSK